MTRSAVVLSTALVAASLLLTSGTPTRAQPVVHEDDDPAARQLLELAARAAVTTAYEGSVTIISFDSGGPTVVEIDVAQGADGTYQAGQVDRWLVGRDDEGAFYLRGDELLQLGESDAGARGGALAASIKYVLWLEAPVALDTGRATPIAIGEVGAEHVRERLFIDDVTDLAVRRETFNGDGSPDRLVAFTTLVARRTPLEGADAAESRSASSVMPVSGRSRAILADVGWVVPAGLPGAFDLRSSSAVGDASTGSLHLLYSDGLYSVSVYQQPGDLQARALDGAQEVDLGDVRVHRWPGAEPERLVWSGDGMVFTVVSDAPTDVLASLVSELPHDEAPSMPGRLFRGIARIGGWLWPFD